MLFLFRISHWWPFFNLHNQIHACMHESLHTDRNTRIFINLKPIYKHFSVCVCVCVCVCVHMRYVELIDYHTYTDAQELAFTHVHVHTHTTLYVSVSSLHNSIFPFVSLRLSVSLYFSLFLYFSMRYFSISNYFPCVFVLIPQSPTSYLPVTLSFNDLPNFSLPPSF